MCVGLGFFIVELVPGCDVRFSSIWTMLCTNPFVRLPNGKVTKKKLLNGDMTGVPFPCGQCMNCRINKRRQWTLRMLLENSVHVESCFVTLTYSDENLVYNKDYQKQLCKKDFQDFMKRLRKYYDNEGKKIRYFACGEYGSKTKRPHYHFILFGAMADQELIEKIWGYGLVHVGTCTADSIQYVAGYVLKKFVNKKRDTITPEFILSSRRPGIGFYAVQDFVDISDNEHFVRFILENNDIPTVLAVGGRFFPIDRYLKNKISDALKIDSDKQFLNFVNSTLDKQCEAREHGMSLYQYETTKDLQKSANREALTKIYNSRSSI